MAKQTTGRQLAPPAPAAPDAAFRDAVLRGLNASPRTLECKFFYDERGSELFDAICRQPEYYLTRTETGILERHGADIAAAIGPGAELVELGSGASRKTRIVLRALERPARYVPVDISADYLRDAAARIDGEFPRLAVRPVVADFTAPFRLPPRLAGSPRLLFFPGSTLGNFHPDAAGRFLDSLRRSLAPDALLIGVDRKKDRALLEAAYDDGAGVTAEFNLNLLARINRELDADFDLDGFRHRAVYADPPGRMEMYLVSTREQTVRVAGQSFAFAAGEAVHTENSYKYAPEEFAALAAQAGWRVRESWEDERGWFGVYLLVPA